MPQLSSERAPLSVVIITRNEAANISACLATVSFAAECIVVDSGSTDGTPGPLPARPGPRSRTRPDCARFRCAEKSRTFRAGHTALEW